MSIIANELKRCSHCRESKPLSEFHNNKRNTDGKHRDCKDCRKLENAKYRVSKREKEPDYFSNYDREYSKANPEKRSANVQARRAKVAGVFKEKIDVRSLRERDGDLCCWCLREMTWEWKHGGDNTLYRSVEHLDSVNSAGDHSYENARLAHMVCNSSKGNKSRWEFLIYLSAQEEAGLLDYSTGRFKDEPIF